QFASPNGRWAVIAEQGNLVRIDRTTGQRLALTTDAEPDYAYAIMPDSDLASLTRRLAGTPATPFGLWSPDGERLLTYRVDQRHLYKMPIVVNVVRGVEHQLPFVHFQNTALPDEDRTYPAELMIFDMSTGRRVDLQIPPPMVLFSATPQGGWFWSADGRKVFAAPDSKDFRAFTVYEADAQSGAARAIVTESSDLTLRPDATTRFHVLGNGEQIILYSERSDWGQFYLYDGKSGRLKNAITRGECSVHGMTHVDERKRWFYYTAGGCEPGRDPYYSHLYRVRLEGGKPKLLTPENAQHTPSVSTDGRYIVDTYSTVSEAPVHVLRGADGKLITELERADISGLAAIDWRAPIRFKVKAADGATDIYGVMFLPSRFDPSRKYPIIDAQYSAPHVVWAPRAFLQQRQEAMALAQLGFVVIHVDGRATPLRRQSQQDLGFAGKQSAPMLVEDHKVAMEQLAQRHSFIDIDKVGVYGHSAGGYRAARAMLQFPEFYKVGIATAGSHDAYVHSSLARYYGRPQEFPDGFGDQPNMPLAKNLRGKLLLAHGDVDDDVHVGVTLQLADALIAAGKDFDMFIYPGRNHANLWNGYMLRKGWGYFLQHLRDEAPLTDFTVPDPQ
ncbi:S9 family peptidase, partial [Steroidobacter sp.]|uniref:S9 family peptidase n=1 Tax=Steroidobacter sp. TaxID=1978227 RepID=UPI0025ED2A43